MNKGYALKFTVVFIQSGVKCVNIFQRRQWGNVTARGKDKVWIILHVFQKLHTEVTHLFRRAVGKAVEGSILPNTKTLAGI